MATRPCDRKSVCQEYVDILLSAKQYAMSYGYSEVMAKRIAMVVLNRLTQTGSAALYLAFRPIERGTATGGQQSAKEFNRLVAGRKAKRKVNLYSYRKAWWQ